MATRPTARFHLAAAAIVALFCTPATLAAPKGNPNSPLNDILLRLANR